MTTKPARTLTALTDAELADELAAAKERIAELEDTLHEWRMIEDELKAEGERRALEAWWQSHPGMRLEVGDKLLSGDYFNSDLLGRRPDVLVVSAIHTFCAVILVTAYQDKKLHPMNQQPYWSGYLSLETARNMRTAFLDRERAGG